MPSPAPGACITRHVLTGKRRPALTPHPGRQRRTHAARQVLDSEHGTAEWGPPRGRLQARASRWSAPAAARGCCAARARPCRRAAWRATRCDTQPRPVPRHAGGPCFCPPFWRAHACCLLHAGPAQRLDISGVKRGRRVDGRYELDAAAPLSRLPLARTRHVTGAPQGR